jgi:Asp-tRNA(Asn)/Glu-tRNA(Gln) amidotransferase B subunit
MTARSFLLFANRNVADFQKLIAALRQGKISAAIAQARRKPLDANAAAIVEAYRIASEVLLLQRVLRELIKEHPRPRVDSLPNGERSL